MTAQVVKDSINNIVELQGKSQSWKYHFMAHHWTHNTATALDALEARKQKTSMKEVFADRDRGDAPSDAVDEPRAARSTGCGSSTWARASPPRSAPVCSASWAPR